LPSKITHVTPTIVEIEIDIPADRVARGADRIYADLARKSRVRGFRKGKAPRAVLKRLYGSAVLAELTGSIVGDALTEAIGEHDLDIVSEPSIADLPDLEDGAAYSFKARVEVRPRLESIDTEGVEIARHRIEVTEEQVDEEIAGLRSSMATIEDLEEPRPARSGDLVRLEMKRWVDGAWEEPPLPPRDVALEQGEVSDQIMEKVVGASEGDEVVLDFGKPSESEERSRVLARVLSVKERRLPDLDDELAKDIGDFETLDELRADVRTRMEEAASRREDDRIKHEIFAALREKNQMDLPESLVERQADEIRARLGGMLGEAPDGEEGAAALQKLAEGAKETAREVVHQHFLLLEIARHNELEVKDEEVDAELERMAESTGLPLPKIRAELGSGPRLEELKTRLLETKVLNIVKPGVKITEIDPPAQTAAGADRE